MDVGTGGSGVSRYALYDEDPEADKELGALEVACNIQWVGEQTGCSTIQAEVLVLGFGDQAVSFLLERVVESKPSRYVKVASINVAVPEELSIPFQKATTEISTCDVYCLREDVEASGKGDVVESGVCVVVCGLPLGPHEAVRLGDTIMATVAAARVVVLESGRHLELVADEDGSGESNQVRCLMTKEARKVLGEREAPCPLLAAPNMISGGAAQIMANCQYQGVAATAYVAYRDVHDINVASLRVFEVALTADVRLKGVHAADADSSVRFAAAVARAQQFSTPNSLYA